MSDDNQRPIEVGAYVEWNPSANTHIKGEVTAIRSLAGVNFAAVRIDYDLAHPAPHSWQGQTHELGCARLRRIPRPAEAQAMVPEDSGKNCAACGRRFCDHYHEACGGPAPAPPAPVLVDGLSPNDCYQRWTANRAAIELGEPLRYPTLTAGQIAAGRAAWRSGNEPKRLSAALSAQVAAGREAERNRVTYCEVDPWE